MALEITCYLEGAEEFRQAMQQLDSAMQKYVHELLAGWAENVKALAKQLAPVRTGYLRSSIYAKVHDWVAEIGAEATYALFVEFGTRRMQAQPFIYPALQEHLPQLEQIILEAIDQAKAEAGLP
jgi:HK97 gp10 family phage protein